jgi:hypothetical protein
LLRDLPSSIGALAPIGVGRFGEVDTGRDTNGRFHPADQWMVHVIAQAISPEARLLNLILSADCILRKISFRSFKSRFALLNPAASQALVIRLLDGLLLHQEGLLVGRRQLLSDQSLNLSKGHRNFVPPLRTKIGLESRILGHKPPSSR